MRVDEAESGPTTCQLSYMEGKGREGKGREGREGALCKGVVVVACGWSKRWL